MHARELTELAAVLATHGPVLAHHAGRLSRDGLDQYWTASKSRLQRWSQSLKSLLAAAIAEDRDWCQTHWPTLRAVLEEILVGELLTRVWTAVVCAHDRHHGHEEGEPVVRSVMIGHLEARHRVLTMLVNGRGIDAPEVMRLEHLRRRTERWSDMLVGYLGDLYDITDLAIDPERARDFTHDLRTQIQAGGADHAWSLVQAGVRAAFQQGLSDSSPNADLNARIAGSILACFPDDVFNSLGLFRTLWSMRLSQTTSDAQGMIDLLLDHPGTPQPMGPLQRWSGRSRPPRIL